MTNAQTTEIEKIIDSINVKQIVEFKNKERILKIEKMDENRIKVTDTEGLKPSNSFWGLFSAIKIEGSGSNTEKFVDTEMYLNFIGEAKVVEVMDFIKDPETERQIYTNQ